MNKELDVLVFGAHPDDVELGCGGTVAKMVASGVKLAIVDLTRGELGTRGSAELRDEEARRSADILGVETRVNLGLKDGFFQCDEQSLLKVIEVLRKYKPLVVIANALHDRHPDHGRGGTSSSGMFSIGLVKLRRLNIQNHTDQRLLPTFRITKAS